MKQRMILLLAAAASFLVAADGLGQPIVAPKTFLQTPAQKLAFEAGITKATAALDAAVKLRLDRSVADTLRARDVAALTLRSDALKRVNPPRTQPAHASAPAITEVYAPNGAAPWGLVILFGSNLKAADGSTEIHVLLGQQDLLGKPLSGDACTLERCEVTMPDFSGITGPTPASIVVKQGGMTSQPASVMLKPELVQQSLDLVLLKSALLADFKGTPLVYDEAIGPDMFRLLDRNTIQAMHRRPYGSPDASGSDEYFLTTQLKNNWVIKDIAFYDAVSLGPGANPGQSSAGYSGVKWGTASPYIQVSWFNMTATYNQSIYYVRYVVEGPKGTSYN